MILSEHSNTLQIQEQIGNLKADEQKKAEDLKDLIKKSTIDISQIFRRSRDEVDVMLNVLRSQTEVEDQKKQRRTIEGSQINDLRSLCAEWENLLLFKKEVEKIIQKDLHNANPKDEKLRYFLKVKPGYEKLFRWYHHLIEGGKTSNLLERKTPQARHNELKKMVHEIAELTKMTKDLLEIQTKRKQMEMKLDGMEREFEMKEAQAKREKEQQAEEGRIEVERNNIRNKLGEIIRSKEKAPSRFDRESEKMAALLLKKDEIAEYFPTCFQLDILETRTFQEIMTEVKSTGLGNMIRTPELLPSTEGVDPEKELLKIWNKDKETSLRYMEALEVNDKMGSLERRILGEKKLESAKEGVSQMKEDKKKVSDGKIIEKIILLALGERLKGSKRFELISVDDVIDYHGHIDCVIKILPEVGKNEKIELLGIDITTNEEKKNQDPYSGSIELKKEIAEKVLGTDTIRDNRYLLNKSFSFNRKIILTPTNTDFVKSIVDQLFHVLKTKNVKEIGNGIANDIYDISLKNSKASEEKTPKTIKLIMEAATSAA